MKILLDECVPRRLAAPLDGHDVQTVPQVGWAGIKNGKLLKLTEAEFDVFITVDRNLSFQQDLTGLRLAVIVLGAQSNRFEDLLPLVPQIVAALATICGGEVRLIEA